MNPLFFYLQLPPPQHPAPEASVPRLVLFAAESGVGHLLLFSAMALHTFDGEFMGFNAHHFLIGGMIPSGSSWLLNIRKIRAIDK